MRVRVDPGAARDVAAAYADAPPSREPLVAAAYARLVAESDHLFRHLTAPDRPDQAQPKAVLLDPAVLRRSITAALRPRSRPTTQAKGSSS